MAFLITLYEEERKRLEALIKECLEDFEAPNYLLAHNHQKALYRVDDSIRTLNRLEDSDYDHKQFCLRLIAKFEKDIETTDSEYMKKYFFEMLQVYKEKLEKINSIVPSAKSQSNAGILETALVDLVSKKIKKFKIIFNKSERVSLELSAKGQVVKIVSSIIKKDAIHNSELDLLQKLGFELTNNNKLVFQLKNKDDSSLVKLRFLLTRLVFDVSYFRHPAGENFIEFPY